ncbi:unnamed protein product [Schistosoma rodhaini]|nr:unnamed protein product [Schistosoma rodhaini]CAH8288379.1 unnamed protein product [Schistosoma rodhaini]
MKTKLDEDAELKPESETSRKKNTRSAREQIKETRKKKEIKTIIETDSEMSTVGEVSRGEKDSEENEAVVRSSETSEPPSDDKQGKRKKKVTKSEEKQSEEKGKKRRGSKSSPKDDDKNIEKLVDQIKVENEMNKTKQRLKKEKKLDDQYQKEGNKSEADEFLEHNGEKEKNEIETVKVVDNQFTIDVNNSESTESQNKQNLIDQETNKRNDETGQETSKQTKDDEKIGIDKIESIVSTEYSTENQVNNKPESFEDFQQIITESVQKPQRRESKTKKHGKDTKKNRSVTDTTTTGNDEDLTKDYIIK